ncbi:MAG: 3-carboxy-cis,cis-muconate cycloisomerase [Alphaproteobacteria bacterium]|nr:3-carboxy-cis,cis-muconate cycloisomerase [Alphaproteobacteria bacterium]MBU1563133.1 3-carboxy-cis,cis-muconate cycloisomerase [Alphaproteobacteria bacterium]MBU2302115.1 3-carboxy-cis,cis-muconate cycloisomerase [Alphaproteobacteria bacterium]MBU2368942.1 3-carboxy-cis,cis-muconate cycloisomerase [Alphaproteobacteria bacterium]
MSPHRTLLDALAGDEEIETLLGDPAQIASMVRVEQALARAEAEAGMITARAATAIETGLAGFAPDWDDLAAGMARDGVVIPALVAQLRRHIAAPHAEALHKGATSQDIIDTALMLQLAAVIGVFADRLTDLLDALDGLTERHGAQAMMAHTRMQRALPYTVAAKLTTWIVPLRRALAELRAIRPSLLVVQLGGPIGDRSSFGSYGEAVARALARQLDLGLAEPWHSSRDQLIGFASLLALLSGTLGKLGADVAILAQNEIGAISIAGGGGSSSMAHKSNPVNAEVLVALARHNAGLVGTLHQSMVHENERSGAAWTLEWFTFPRIVIATGASLRLARLLVDQIDFPASASS